MAPRKLVLNPQNPFLKPKSAIDLKVDRHVSRQRKRTKTGKKTKEYLEKVKDTYHIDFQERGVVKRQRAKYINWWDKLKDFNALD